MDPCLDGIRLLCGDRCGRCRLFVLFVVRLGSKIILSGDSGSINSLKIVHRVQERTAVWRWYRTNEFLVVCSGVSAAGRQSSSNNSLYCGRERNNASPLNVFAVVKRFSDAERIRVVVEYSGLKNLKTYDMGIFC